MIHSISSLLYNPPDEGELNQLMRAHNLITTFKAEHE